MANRYSEELVNTIQKSRLNHAKLISLFQKFINPKDIILLLNKDKELYENEEFIEWLKEQNYNMEVWKEYKGENLTVHKYICEKLKSLSPWEANGYVQNIIFRSDSLKNINDSNKKIEILKLYKPHVVFSAISSFGIDLNTLNEENKKYYEEKKENADIIFQKDIYTNEELQDLAKKISYDERFEIFNMLNLYKGENIEFAINLFDNILQDLSISLLGNSYVTGKYALKKLKEFNNGGNSSLFGKSDELDRYIVSNNTTDELLSLAFSNDVTVKKTLDYITTYDFKDTYHFFLLLTSNFYRTNDLEYLQTKLEEIESNKGIDYILQGMNETQIRTPEEFYSCYFTIAEKKPHVLETLINYFKIDFIFEKYKGQDENLIKRILEKKESISSYERKKYIEFLGVLHDEKFILDKLQKSDLGISECLSYVENFNSKNILIKYLIERYGLLSVTSYIFNYRNVDLLKFVFDNILENIPKEEIAKAFLGVVSILDSDSVIELLEKFNFNYSTITGLRYKFFGDEKISNFIEEHYKKYLLLDNYKENDENYIKNLINQIDDLQSIPGILLHQLVKINDVDYIISILKKINISPNISNQDFIKICNKSDEIFTCLINQYGIDFIINIYHNQQGYFTLYNESCIKLILSNIPLQDARFLDILVLSNDTGYILQCLENDNLNKEKIETHFNQLCEKSLKICEFFKNKYGYEIFKNYKGNNQKLIEYSIIATFGIDLYNSYSEVYKQKLISAYNLIYDKEKYLKLIETNIASKFLEITKIDILDFLKYSNDDFILKSLSDIFSNDTSKFQKLFNIFTNYFNNDKLFGVPFLTSAIEFFGKYPELSNLIISKENLTSLEQKNILKLLERDDYLKITTLEELNDLEIIVDNEISNALNNPNISIQELKSIFLKNFVNRDFKKFGNLLSYKINTQTLNKILAKKDNMSEGDYLKVYNLYIFMTFITEVYALEDKEKLKEALRLINTQEKRESYNEIFKYFSDIEEKIRDVYEIDANATLTNLETLPESLYNEEYSYYDLSHSEYGLYTHATTLSDLEGLVNSRYEGYGHICVSGISDKMRKGNYHGDVIVLYDHIPKGNFIASSPFNISSNSYISTNSFHIPNDRYLQLEFKDNSSYKFANQSSHSETNIFRDGLIPSGVLVRGDNPTEEEIKAQTILQELTGQKIPLVKVQKPGLQIENPQKIETTFESKTINSKVENLKELKEKLGAIKETINQNYSIFENVDKRKIGIITDIHGLDVPLKVALEDMRSKGITEIYSLGDNLEDGPNPKEVMRLLDEYGVISIAGNAEEYITLGTEPFSYLGADRISNNTWTKSELSDYDKEKIAKYPHSIELTLGGKKIGLCHFATDVRTDYDGVWKYQSNVKNGSAYLQFSETNSGGESKGNNAAYVSRDKDPLFNGKKVDLYDAIIQGHTHFKITEQSPHTNFYTLRANGMGYRDNPNNTSSYVILEETEGGYKIDEVLVEFDRIKLAESVVSSNLPDKSKIIKFTGLTEEELRIASENLEFGNSGRK